MIRAAETRHDLERCVEICNAVHPEDPVVLEQLADSDGPFLLHEGGGYAFVDRSSVPGSAYAMVRVRPDARRGGIGSAREARHSPVAFVAVSDGEVVGYARLYETGKPHRLENGLTAVLPSHRRRGIAIALKRAELARAAEHGYREVVAEMAGDNTAIRAVNERLGYRPLPASIVVSGSVV